MLIILPNDSKDKRNSDIHPISFFAISAKRLKPVTNLESVLAVILILNEMQLRLDGLHTE